MCINGAGSPSGGIVIGVQLRFPPVKWPLQHPLLSSHPVFGEHLAHGDFDSPSQISAWYPPSSKSSANGVQARTPPEYMPLQQLVSHSSLETHGAQSPSKHKVPLHTSLVKLATVKLFTAPKDTPGRVNPTPRAMDRATRNRKNPPNINFVWRCSYHLGVGVATYTTPSSSSSSLTSVASGTT